MQPLLKHYSLRAALLFPIHKPPEVDVWVNVRDSQITSIGTAEEKVRYDPGDCAVLPGLVNAHAHLEFSDLQTPLGKREIPLADWIGEVFTWRTLRERQTTHQRVAEGIAQSVAAGVIAIADIVSEDESFTDTPLYYRAFHELIATNDEQVAIAIEKIRCFDAEEKNESSQYGLSPHAPYSVAKPIWEKVVARASASNIPLAVHLAETRDELVFLATGKGRFDDLLTKRGVHDFAAAGKNPLSFLKILATAPRTLIAHGNYLRDEEIKFLAHHNDRFTVVYCPRTHAYFGHDPYPLESMLEAGVQVAIGTDGRGSNPDLSLWREMQHIAQTHPAVSGEAILQMGTLAGTCGLGLADRIGTLEAGKEASLAVIRLTEDRRHDPHARLLDRKSEVVATIIAGNLVAGNLEQPAR
ncbi:MAG: amidohydrolase family protein [Pirellulales bacterium]|nr:amidohydrolase family protein [Pirellulales bacterium]